MGAVNEPKKAEANPTQGAAMEKVTETKDQTPPPPQKTEPSPKQGYETKTPADKPGSPFDIFTSSNIEDSAIGKMASRLNDVSLDELSGEAQEIMNRLKKLK
jgi:hypothetical protein